jgi:cell division protein ZapA
MLPATYDEFERVLRDARALPEPAEAHGTLAGALCSSRDYGLIEWLREIRDTGKVVGADRIAVMAALNMANELLRLRKLDTDLHGAVTGRVKQMRERVEGALQRTRQLDL